LKYKAFLEDKTAVEQRLNSCIKATNPNQIVACLGVYDVIKDNYEIVG